MLAAPVAGVAVERGGRGAAAEGAVVADVDPEPAGVGLALRQHRHRGVVAVQPLGGEHVRGDPVVQRRERGGAGADLVGERREAEIDAFAGIALGLAVQRLVLAELLEEDRRQQVRPGPAARRRMERRRRLADPLAVPAGELLAHGLDHLPAARDHLERLGDVLAELDDPPRAAGLAAGRRRHDHALARQVRREGLAHRAPTLPGRRRCRPMHRAPRRRGRPRSPWPRAPRAAVPAARAAAPCARTASRRAPAAASRSRAGAPRSSPRRSPAPPGPARPPAAFASAAAARASAAARAVRRASISLGSGVMSRVYRASPMRWSKIDSSGQRNHPAAEGRQVCRGFRQSMPSSR